jgi:NAD-dependent deacetylase
MGEALDRLAALLSDGGVLVFTGAGMSTESGLPDFRSPGGIWTRYDPALFEFERYVSDRETRIKLWQFRREFASANPEPNVGHLAVAALEQLGLVLGVVTQNIDGLHHAAGSRRVLEVHGNLREVFCLSCRRRWPIEDALLRVEAGEEDPPCLDCGGILKATAVTFGEALPETVFAEAQALARSCRTCLVLGSSLVVWPAAGIPLEALECGAGLAIVNLEETFLDDRAEVVLRGKVGEVLTAVLNRLGLPASDRSRAARGGTGDG